MYDKLVVSLICKELLQLNNKSKGMSIKMGKVLNQPIHQRRNTIGQYKHISPVIGEVSDDWQPIRITGGGAQRLHQRKECWSDKNRKHSSPAEQAGGGSRILFYFLSEMQFQGIQSLKNFAL